MIGSQVTKGMHALTKFAPQRASCGVWTDTMHLVAIEAYPSACKSSQTMAILRQSCPALDHEDNTDALTCALMAYLLTRVETLWLHRISMCRQVKDGFGCRVMC